MCGHELVLCIQKLGRSLAEEGEGELNGVAAVREKTKILSVFPVQLFLPQVSLF